MDALDRFKKRMELSGGNLRNEKIKNSKELLKETFEHDASFMENIYMWSVGKKEYTKEDLVGIRIYKRAFSSANGVTMKFQTMIENPVIVGDVLYNKNTNKYYLCTESFNIDKIHWQGKLTMCNWILKWQNQYGEIFEYPCHDINATQYNSGERSNSQFTIGSSQHMVTLPCDKNTVILKSPQRFFLDKDLDNPTSFIITQNDTTSYNYGDKGLVKITLYESVYDSEKDRIDLGICDFKDEMMIKDKNIDNEVISEITNKNKEYKNQSVISYDDNIIKSGGSSKKFIGIFYNENGEIIDKKCYWNIICDFSDKLNIKEYDNCIEISVNDDSIIDEEFKLCLSDGEMDSKFNSSVIIRIESLL